MCSGVEEVNYDLYPDKDYQMKWLQQYLQADFKAKGRSPEQVTDLDVERLYVQANKCACVRWTSNYSSNDPGVFLCFSVFVI